MKKILSFVLAFLLFTMSFAVAFNVTAIDDDLIYDYAFYDFNEGEVVPHAVNSGYSEDSEGKTFYPFLSRDKTASLSQENLTVTDGGVKKTVSALKIEANEYSNLIFTDKNGVPFEARPNVTYTVRVKAYIKYFGKWSQFFYGFGFSGHETPDYKTANETIQYVDHRLGDTFKGAKAQYAKFGTGSDYYNDSSERYSSTFDTSQKYYYYDKTYTFTLSNSDSSTDPFIAHDESGNEYKLNNYFGAFLSMSSVTLPDGTKVKSTVYIDSIEIFANDSAAKVTMYDGEEKIGETYAKIGDGLPSAPEKEGYEFLGWYTDKAYTQKANGVIDNPNLILYAYYINPNAPKTVKYYFGENLIKTEKLKVGSALWDGAGMDGYYFEGWYTDTALKIPYNRQSVESDVTLYGKFLPYKTKYTATSFSRSTKVKAYYKLNGEIRSEFSGCGWNWAGITADKKLISRNNRTWAQSGAYIIRDEETNEMFVPEPGASYEITVKYKVERMDATSAKVNIGYGMKKEFYADITDKNFVDSKMVASHTAADVGDKEYTATLQINVPDVIPEDLLSCLGIYTSYTGRSDQNNASPLSQLVFSEITVERKNTESIISFDGAAVLTEEAYNTAKAQAMRFYYSYTVNENGKTVIDGEEKEVVARGILLKDSENEASLSVNTPLSSGIINIFNNNLDSCWNYDSDTGRVTFSAFVFGLNENDNRNISARGYIVTSDGTVYYSSVKSRSVKQIMDITINTLPENTTEKEKITIMLVIGQSNAEGAGYSEERGVVSAANGMWELSAKPTTTKYGEVFMATSKAGVTKLGPENEYSTNFLDTKGGYGPAFAAKWNELTGEKVVILQLALGATSLAEWQKDANTKGLYKELNFTQYNGSTNPSGNRGYNATDGYYLYSRAVTAYNNTYEALSKQYEISHGFYVWNQGESNEAATASTHTVYGDEKYAEYFEKMHNDLLNDCKGLQMGTIIAVRSCKSQSNTLGKAVSGASTGPRRAQYRLSFKLDSLNTVSYLTESCNGYANYWSKVPEGMLYGKDYDLIPSYKGCSYAYSNMHYSQLKYNEMGAQGAENLYKILYGTQNFDGVAVRDANGDLIGKFGIDGSGSFTVKNDGTIKTKYLQIRPEDASCTYDFSLSVNKESSTLTVTVFADGSHKPSGDEYISEYGEVNWSKLGSDTLNIKCEIIK